MIRLLRSLGIIALVVTLATYVKYGNTLLLQWYIAIFFGVAMVAWLTSFFYARKAFLQVICLVDLTIYFLWELIKASFVVAYEVLTPSQNMQAGIIAIPLDTTSDLEITIFSSLVSLTPGTLSVDVSADKSLLFVHAMYIDKDNIAALKNELKNGFERRVIRILE